jgi:hypothetical protein
MDLFHDIAVSSAHTRIQNVRHSRCGKPLPEAESANANLKCDHHAKATREYLVCIHVMNGQPISLFEEAKERTPSKDGEAGWMVCAVCAELDEEGLLANTTLICGNCADRLMAEQDFVR